MVKWCFCIFMKVHTCSSKVITCTSGFEELLQQNVCRNRHDRVALLNNTWSHKVVQVAHVFVFVCTVATFGEGVPRHPCHGQPHLPGSEPSLTRGRIHDDKGQPLTKENFNWAQINLTKSENTGCTNACIQRSSYQDLTQMIATNWSASPQQTLQIADILNPRTRS